MPTIRPLVQQMTTVTAETSGSPTQLPSKDKKQGGLKKTRKNTAHITLDRLKPDAMKVNKLPRPVAGKGKKSLGKSTVSSAASRSTKISTKKTISSPEKVKAKRLGVVKNSSSPKKQKSTRTLADRGTGALKVDMAERRRNSSKKTSPSNVSATESIAKSNIPSPTELQGMDTLSTIENTALKCTTENERCSPSHVSPSADNTIVTTSFLGDRPLHTASSNRDTDPLDISSLWGSTSHMRGRAESPGIIYHIRDVSSSSDSAQLESAHSSYRGKSGEFKEFSEVNDDENLNNNNNNNNKNKNNNNNSSSLRPFGRYNNYDKVDKTFESKIHCLGYRAATTNRNYGNKSKIMQTSRAQHENIDSDYNRAGSCESTVHISGDYEKNTSHTDLLFMPSASVKVANPKTNFVDVMDVKDFFHQGSSDVWDDCIVCEAEDQFQIFQKTISPAPSTTASCGFREQLTDCGNNEKYLQASTERQSWMQLWCMMCMTQGDMSIVNDKLSIRFAAQSLYRQLYEPIQDAAVSKVCKFGTMLKRAGMRGMMFPLMLVRQALVERKTREIATVAPTGWSSCRLVCPDLFCHNKVKKKKKRSGTTRSYQRIRKYVYYTRMRTNQKRRSNQVHSKTDISTASTDEMSTVDLDAHEETMSECVYDKVHKQQQRSKEVNKQNSTSSMEQFSFRNIPDDAKTNVNEIYNRLVAGSTSGTFMDAMSCSSETLCEANNSNTRRQPDASNNSASSRWVATPISTRSMVTSSFASLTSEELAEHDTENSGQYNNMSKTSPEMINDDGTDQIMQPDETRQSVTTFYDMVLDESINNTGSTSRLKTQNGNSPISEQHQRLNAVLTQSKSTDVAGNADVPVPAGEEKQPTPGPKGDVQQDTVIKPAQEGKSLEGERCRVKTNSRRFRNNLAKARAGMLQKKQNATAFYIDFSSCDDASSLTEDLDDTCSNSVVKPSVEDTMPRSKENKDPDNNNDNDNNSAMNCTTAEESMENKDTPDHTLAKRNKTDLPALHTTRQVSQKASNSTKGQSKSLNLNKPQSSPLRRIAVLHKNAGDMQKTVKQIRQGTAQQRLNSKNHTIQNRNLITEKRDLASKTSKDLKSLKENPKQLKTKETKNSSPNNVRLIKNRGRQVLSTASH